MPLVQSRRRFLADVAWVGAASLGAVGFAGLGTGTASLVAEPPPEITTIRLERDTITCIAPQVAEELLRAEGFREIRFVEDDNPVTSAQMIARGEVDLARDFAPVQILAMEAGLPITILTGLHLGCFEVFARDSIHGITDLKGKTIGTRVTFDSTLLTLMAASVGLDPARDIKLIMEPSMEPMRWFMDGKIDAFIAVPPELQQVRASNTGHVILSSITDRPWSQYYCCLFAAGTEFVRKYPVATKRVLRAILKGADLCASQPAHMAQLLVDRGYATRYDYALQALSEIRYDVWRDYDPEDTLRFYALRLHEAGLVKSDPNKLIAEHTDWRFLNDLKRELKV